MVAADAQNRESQLDSSLGYMHLLGDATRVRLLSLLETEELSVAELVSIMALGQSRVSTHLGKLREAGLVHDRKVGSSTRYRVHADMPASARTLWDALRAQLGNALEADLESLRLWQSTAAGGTAWADRFAGEMERHYSPGRTWEALGHGFCGLLALGDVVDIGCGDGFSARMLAARSRSYTGVDQSQRVVEAATMRVPEGATFVVGDMHALPLPDASFDSVMLFHALSYSDRPAEVLSEAFRVARCGARLAVLTLDAHNREDITRAYGHRSAGFSPESLRRLLNESGFVVRSADVTTRERREPHFSVVTAVADKPLS